MFSATGSSINTFTSNVTLGLAVLDSSGNYLSGSAPVTTNLSCKSEDAASVSVSFADGLTWADGYKVVAVVHGNGKSPATDSYIITNISVSATEAVPEPSAFGLLAGVGALALVASPSFPQMIFFIRL